MKGVVASATVALGLMAPAAQACESKVTLTIKSSNYSGPIDIELREGQRPGSKLRQRRQVFTSGTVSVSNVCPGRYFFAFSTPDENSVSVTRHFEVSDDGETYNNPTITVSYSRASGDGAARIGKSKRKDL